MIFSTIKTIAQSTCENFDSNKSSYPKRETLMMALINIVFLILVILVLAFVGQLLWNRFIAGANNGDGTLTCAKKLENFWEILGIYLLVQLLFGGL